MKQEIEILFFLFFWEVEAEFTVPLVSITLNTRTVLGIFSEHSLGWGVFRALCQRCTTQGPRPRLDGSQGPLLRLECSTEPLSRLDGSQRPINRLGGS